MGRIDTELHIIQNNRYGEDVRMAIHDALDKLEKTSGGGSGGNTPVNAMLVGNSAGTPVIGNATFEEV
jgi:hypothetical protein